MKSRCFSFATIYIFPRQIQTNKTYCLFESHSLKLQAAYKGETFLILLVYTFGREHCGVITLSIYSEYFDCFVLLRYTRNITQTFQRTKWHISLYLYQGYNSNFITGLHMLSTNISSSSLFNHFKRKATSYRQLTYIEKN